MTETHTTANIHQEKVFEAHIVACLTADQGYVERDCAAHYDVAHALDTGLLFRFLKTTQPEAWQTLEDHYSAQAEAEVLKRLDKALKDAPTHVVLREGIKLVPNIRFALCFFKPASNLNPDLTRLYEANILSVMRQVHYSAKDPKKSIDIVTFVNGIPVATLEVKNMLTGQNVKHAERQYRQDRSPAGEPLLTFKRGAIVHFAVDQDNVSMTTRLMNGKTRFLPFNRGRDGGAGNPDVPGENRVAYLYKDLPEGRAVFSREVLLDLIGRFIHLERSGGKEVLIFPRFQQFDAVRKVLADARAQGAGQNYLIQHSAGSGKSNTIAWTAHQIINLHDEADRPLFDTAIIVTDRLVLDRQLQNTIGGFAQTEGVVKKIDGTSRDLKDAILKGARIIITTIQKFGTEHLATISGQAGRNFAVIIDEAHSSQSGKAAQAMSDALTRDATSSDDIEDMVLAFQKARGPQKNISFLAFTATPRNVTLERFGRVGPDGKPHPFHLYSMRQAIEEEFIVDVLKNYMTYEAYYQLEKTIEDDPAFKGRKAQSACRALCLAAPHGDRPEGRGDRRAFPPACRDATGRSGEGDDRDAEPRTCPALLAAANPLHRGQGLYRSEGAGGVLGRSDHRRHGLDRGDRERLRRDGAAQEIRHRRVSGPRGGREIPDRVRPAQAGGHVCRQEAGGPAGGADAGPAEPQLRQGQADIRARFPEHDGGDQGGVFAVLRGDRAGGTHGSQPDLRSRTAHHERHLYRQGRGRAVRGSVLQGRSDDTGPAGARRHRAPRRGAFILDEDEAQQEEFRQLIKSFLRFYAFVAQVVSLNDAWLEKLYAYSAWLSRLLPSRDVPADITITDDMLTLSAFKLAEKRGGQRVACCR